MKLLWDDQVTRKALSQATHYLQIRYGDPIAGVLMSKLRNAPLQMGIASDLLRSASRQPLPLNDGGVQEHLQELRRGIKLNPILIVHTPFGNDIANGYHTLSLAFHAGVRTPVPFAMAHLDPVAS